MLWGLFVLIAIIVVGFLWQATVGRSRVTEYNRLELNQAVYRDRVNEIQQDLEAGRIDQQAFDALDLELKKLLLEDAHISDKPVSLESKHNTAIKVGMILTPIVGAGLYFLLADWSEFLRWEAIKDKNAIYSADQSTGSEWLQELTNEELVLLLRTRLHEEPEDAKGWFILGQTLAQLGAPVPATDALTKALKHERDDDAFRLGVAQVLVSIGQPKALEIAKAEIARTLHEKPQHEGAQAILGFLHFRQNEFEKAIDTWQTLIDKRVARGEDGQGVAMLRQQIQVAKQQLASTSDQQSEGKLLIQLSLADHIKGQLPPNATVFVIVKGDDGMPAPVAVRRLTVADLPTQLSISDADAMMPGRTISTMNQIHVVARISYSGTAKAQVGDWESDELSVSAKSNTSLQLRIERKIESL